MAPKRDDEAAKLAWEKKVAAAKKSLGFINPDVEIVDLNYDIVRRTPRPALARSTHCSPVPAADGRQRWITSSTSWA